MAARKKAKRKSARKAPRRKAARRAPARKARPESPDEFVVRVAGQMAKVIERGLARTLRKLPARAASAAAKTKLRAAVGALRRQAESFRQQAHELEARGAEAAAAVWRPLADRFDKAASAIGRRLPR